MCVLLGLKSWGMIPAEQGTALQDAVMHERIEKIQMKNSKSEKMWLFSVVKIWSYAGRMESLSYCFWASSKVHYCLGTWISMLMEPGQDAECAARWVAVCATSKTALLRMGIPELCWDSMPASPKCWCINSSVDGDCSFESFLNGIVMANARQDSFLGRNRGKHMLGSHLITIFSCLPLLENLCCLIT